MIELDNTMLLFICSENYSDRLMLGSRVRIPSRSQKYKYTKKMRLGRYNIEKEDVDQYG